jgi:hypothetical protein
VPDSPVATLAPAVTPAGSTVSPAGATVSPAGTTAPSAGASTRDFLAWVARSPRSYAEAMETWRSTCPRHTVWEDALRGGLVQVERVAGGKFGEDRVVLTALGCVVLAAG